MEKLLRVHTGVKITRRKGLCMITDENDLLKFTSPDFGACVVWLDANDHHEFILDGPDGDFSVMIQRKRD